MSEDGRLRLYTELERVDYDEFEASRSGVVGLRRDGDAHDVDLSLGYHADRPTFEVGDTLQAADAFRADGEYAYRVSRDWQLGALATVQSESYDLTTSRDNDLLGADVSARYRGFGARFSPELGIGLARRDAEDDREDHGQRQLWLRVRSRLSDRLDVGGRYRYRFRDYRTDDPAARNLGREDRRHQLVATADLRAGEHVAWSLYAARETADSTLDTRDYVVHLAVLTLRLLF